METDQELQTLERRAYLASYSDGIVDLFVGLSLLWIGVAWIWLPGMAGLAGVLPAVFISVMLTARKRLLESRLGYVKWSESRRRWESRNLAAILAAGVLIFVVGVVVYVLVTQGSTDTRGLSDLVPGLPALLATAGVITVLAERDPGWPLFAAGIVVTVWGMVMVARFVRRYPAVESAR
jgi:hypothetical protein